MTMLFILGGVALTAGCLLIYLASPNQLWLEKPLSTFSARFLGWSSLALSLVLWSQVMFKLTAVFMFAIGITVVWIALPYVGTRFKK